MDSLSVEPIRRVDVRREVPEPVLERCADARFFGLAFAFGGQLPHGNCAAEGDHNGARTRQPLCARPGFVGAFEDGRHDEAGLTLKQHADAGPERQQAAIRRAAPFREPDQRLALLEQGPRRRDRTGEVSVRVDRKHTRRAAHEPAERARVHDADPAGPLDARADCARRGGGDGRRIEEAHVIRCYDQRRIEAKILTSKKRMKTWKIHGLRAFADDPYRCS